MRIFYYCCIMYGLIFDGPHFRMQTLAQKTIVCTTSIIADGVQAIVQFPEEMSQKATFQVITLMRKGIDPHIYKPTPSNLQQVQKATILVHNGLHLEGNMVRLFERLAPYQKVFSIAEGIDSHKFLALSDLADSFDPHIWMHIPWWLEGLSALVEKIIAEDAQNEWLYRKNFANYRQKLLSLHQKQMEKIQEIPEKQRFLITTHDAFSYFSKAYHLPVKALQGVSTQSDFSLK